MSTVTAPIMVDSTGQAMVGKLDDIYRAILLGSSGSTTWERIRANVAAGVGAAMYPVGHQFTVTHSTYGNIIFDVVGHDQVASASGKPHTMTLLAHNCIANAQFDAPEAFYYCASALPAGTYNMVVVGWGQTTSGTYQFTTPAAVPAGGQLRVSGDPQSTAITNLTVIAYSTKGGTTEVWNSASRPAITAGSGGTSLGSWDGALNHIQRICCGSNNYEQSAIRQFLNADGAAGTYWTPQTQFDRPPSWAGSLAGFCGGFDSSFLDCVDVAVVKCSTNATYEAPDSAHAVNTAYTINDRFWLPSRFELYGSSDVPDGSTLMSYYVGATNDDRIKLLSGSPAYWWMRTPYSGDALYVGLVGTDGSLSGSVACYAFSLAPACIIA